MEGESKKERVEHGREWKVVEWQSAPKPGRAYSEDRYLINPACYAVIDGVSQGNSSETIEGLSLGQFAAHIGISALKEAAECQSPLEVVPFVSARLREALSPYTIIGKPSFVFAAYYPRWNVMIRVGDCSYLIDGVGHNPPMRFDVAKDKDRLRRIKEKMARGGTEEEALSDVAIRERHRHLTSTIQHTRLANAPLSGREDFVFDKYRYAVINADDVPEDLVEVIPVAPHVRQIVLATDGYDPSALKPTLAETMASQDEFEKNNPLTHHPDDKTYFSIVPR